MTDTRPPDPAGRMAPVETMPVATWVLRGPTFIVDLADAPQLALWGRTPAELLGKPIFESIPQLSGLGFDIMLTGVLTTGEPLQFTETPIILPTPDGGTRTAWFNAIIQPLRDAPMNGIPGTIGRLMAITNEVTETVLARQLLESQTQKLHALFEQAPVGVVVLGPGPDLVCELANPFYCELVGRTEAQLIGQPLLTVFPELVGLGLEDALLNVLTTGETHVSRETEAPLIRDGQPHTIYVDLVYKPRRAADGAITGVLVVLTDISPAVRARQRAEEHERLLNAMIRQTPLGVAVFHRPDFRIELANPVICGLWGRTQAQVVGKPLFEALPEAAGQGFEELLTGVFKTGIAYIGREMPARLLRNGQLDTVYFDFVYEPLYEPDGSIDRVMVVATDATAARHARQADELVQNRLRLAVEIAELCTWEYDPATGAVICSDRMAYWFGLAPGGVYTLPIILEAVVDWDRVRVTEAIHYALTPASGGMYDSECHLVNLIDGRERTVRAKGQAFFDELGLPYRLLVTVLDITEQQRIETELRAGETRYRTLSEELEQRVKLRTQDLERSNLDLMQFASVASHDLKEPLRKVTTFAILLEGMLAGRLSEPETDMFRRLINATGRMNTLVADVLRLSILSDQTASFEPVSLNTVIDQIRQDLELLIADRHANITNGPLPTVLAAPGQMHQLFQNLISNALKFNTNPVPQIRIETLPLTDELIRDLLLPSPNFAVITVRDNGIGFEQHYADKIFVMFQRLHGRSRYEGTGIGLTIVKKIVDNHRGFIDVQSKPGHGTTFRIVLPVAV